jgi:ATP-dependent DNA ligase
MRVRLITRGSHDWTARYPWIVEAARKVGQTRFVLDGEAVVLVDCAFRKNGTAVSLTNGQ